MKSYIGYITHQEEMKAIFEIKMKEMNANKRKKQHTIWWCSKYGPFCVIECQLKDHCVASIIHLQINFIYLCIKWQNIFHHNFYATLTFATFSNFIVGDIFLIFLQQTRDKGLYFMFCDINRML
jgi:hypothetical protein